MSLNFKKMRLARFLSHWFLSVFTISLGFGLLVTFNESQVISFFSYVLLVLGVSLLLYWATGEDHRNSAVRQRVSSSRNVPSEDTLVAALRLELASRIRETAQFKAELEAKSVEIATLKSGLNRTDAAELNEAIAQLYVGLEFERGRADGEFAQILSGLSESVDALFSAAGLVKGVPTPGGRFIDQPAGSCKVFKTELTSDAALKGTIKAVRSPWVGFMANGKLKVITASNVSVYA
jgi:hypothetical protein